MPYIGKSAEDAGRKHIFLCGMEMDFLVEGW